MRPPRGKAAKQTVSLTIHAELVAQVKQLGINASRVAEEALAREVRHIQAERLRAEVQQDLEASNAYVAKHGSFTQMVRDHYRDAEDE